MLAAAFIGQPTALLVDEPLEALDREMRDAVVEWLATRTCAGATVVVSTHLIEPFLPLVTGAVVMTAGRPRAERLEDDPARRLSQLDGWARGR
jgi:ABC-type multidrug transport system ATPase subunit